MSWISGSPYWPGSGIPYMEGNLPGPFFYLLLIPSLTFNTPYTSLILYTMIWLSLTFTISFYFVKQITRNSSSPLLFLILLLTSDIFRNLLSLPLNNLFSIVFHLALMICLFRWRETKNDLYFPLIGLLIGLGIQIHHSILFHFITTIIFFISNDKIRKGQFKWKYLTFFLTLFLLPQNPLSMGYVWRRQS